MNRLIYLLGALLLTVSPFLSWQNATVLGVTWPLPGFLWHGAWLLFLGTLAAFLSLGPWRPGWFMGVIAFCAAYVTFVDVRQILSRGEYALAQLQLKLASVNSMLAQLNLTPIEIYRRTEDPWTLVGAGPWVACAGAFLLALGVVFERAVFLRCRTCRAALERPMHFCVVCGENRSGRRMCRGCRTELRQKWAYCPACGLGVSS